MKRLLITQIVALGLLAMEVGTALAQPERALRADIDAVRECLTERDNACLLEIGLRLSEDSNLDAAIAQRYAERGELQRAESIFQASYEEIFSRPVEQFSRGGAYGGRSGWIYDAFDLAIRQHRAGFLEDARTTLRHAHRNLLNQLNEYEASANPLRDPLPRINDLTLGMEQYFSSSDYGDSEGPCGFENHTSSSLSDWEHLLALQLEIDTSDEAGQTLELIMARALPRAMRDSWEWQLGLARSVESFMHTYDRFGEHELAARIGNQWLQVLIMFDQSCDSINASVSFIEATEQFLDPESNERIRRHIANFLSRPPIQRQWTNLHLPNIQGVVHILEASSANAGLRLVDGNQYITSVQILEPNSCTVAVTSDCLIQSILEIEPNLGREVNGDPVRNHNRFLQWLYRKISNASRLDQSDEIDRLVPIYIGALVNLREEVPPSYDLLQWEWRLSEQVRETGQTTSADQLFSVIEEGVRSSPHFCPDGRLFLAWYHFRNGANDRSREILDDSIAQIIEFVGHGGRDTHSRGWCSDSESPRDTLTGAAHIYSEVGDLNRRDEAFRALVADIGTNEEFPNDWYLREADDLVVRGRGQFALAYLLAILDRVADPLEVDENIRPERRQRVLAQTAVLGASLDLEEIEQINTSLRLDSGEGMLAAEEAEHSWYEFLPSPWMARLNYVPTF